MVAGTAFIAAMYGLVRLTYGLFLPDIQRDLGLDSTVAGAISSGSSLMYCLAAGTGFVLGRRLPRTLVLAATAAACLGVWGMAAAGDVAVFGICAVVGSAGAGFASPALVTIVARNVEARRVDSAQAMVNGGTGPGLVVAGLLALLLLPEWRTAWILVGVLTIALAAAVLAVDRGPTAERDERSAAASAAWVRAHARPLAAALVMGAGSSAVWIYGRSLLVEVGTGSERSTVVTWIVLGIGATAVIATARPVSTLTPPRAWALTCSLMTGGTALLAIAPQIPGVTLVACLVFGWGFTAGTSALIAWTSAIDPARSPAGTAMLFVALTFGQAVGAGLLGFLIGAAGFAAAFGVAAVLSAAAVAIGATRVSSDPVRAC
ncbi:MFS transporter [Mycolicibacterium sediminis]|uniref:MFS transporter n=1 Tax=Mycolicibacterium sediminis TaxID=1286180 RepID=A0A7I7QT68_9MYCO|nr:MFS transporter [Mycolicibacterium sediminis]BBY29599.1 hypothetical protein MSEDJ_36950 [Mycolicibacterium sediminis]